MSNKTTTHPKSSVINLTSGDVEELSIVVDYAEVNGGIPNRTALKMLLRKYGRKIIQIEKSNLESNQTILGASSLAS